MNTYLVKPYKDWTKLKNTRFFTEIPSYAINKSIPEDSFFTVKDVAKKCYSVLEKKIVEEKIKKEKYIFLEPSAGDGCFFDLLPKNKRIAIDINPRKKTIQKADFLTWYPTNNKKYIVIGNPPFGVRGALALAFIKRALLFADYVAFILPMSFYTNGKGSNMNRVYNGHLIYNKPLKKNSFYLPDNNKKVNVATVFQIWKKGKNKDVFINYDVSEYVEIYTVCSSPTRLCGMDKLDQYDCYLASTFYKNTHVVYSFEEVKYGSGYGLIIKKEKEKILKILSNANWGDYSSVATNNCNHLRMHSIKKLLYDNNIGKIWNEPKKLF